jgi:hypothetical protein
MQQIPGFLMVFCLLSGSAIAAEYTNGKNNASADFKLFSLDPGSRGKTSKALRPGSNQPATMLPRALLQRTPLTAKEKWQYYLRSTYGPASWGYTALGTGISQAEGTVPEWGGGMEGYGKRYGSAFSQKVVNRSVRISLQTLLHEDPRYFASGRSGIWSRALYAASEEFWVRKDSGGDRIGYTRFIGAFSAAYVSRQWHPDSYHTASDYLTAGLQSIGIDAAKNIWTEFWPDIKRQLFH